jgi:hypothetical protein
VLAARPDCSPRPLQMCRLVTPDTLLGWHGTGGWSAGAGPIRRNKIRLHGR